LAVAAEVDVVACAAPDGLHLLHARHRPGHTVVMDQADSRADPHVRGAGAPHRAAERDLWAACAFAHPGRSIEVEQLAEHHLAAVARTGVHTAAARPPHRREAAVPGPVHLHPADPTAAGQAQTTGAGAGQSTGIETVVEARLAGRRRAIAQLAGIEAP